MKCKKCGEEVTYLRYTETVANYGTYDPINGFESDGDSREDGSVSIIFLTPCCEDDVAESIEEADNILNTIDNLKKDEI